MKILYVSHFGGLGGAERSLLELACAVRAAGVEPFVACPEGELARRLDRLGLPRLPIPPSVRGRPRNPLAAVASLFTVARVAWRLIRHARSTGVDLVHANSTLAELVSGPCAWLCRLPNVWHWRDFYDAGRLARVLAPCADRIVAISGATYVDARRQLGSERKLVVVPNAVEEVPVHGGDGGSELWRRRAGAGARDVLVMMAGQSVPRKGHEILIRALAQPAARDRGLRALLFCSELDAASRRHTHELKRLVEATGVGDRVVVETDCDDLWPALRAADVLAVPSLREPFGRIAVEGMFAGLPVVASQVDGLAEIVERDRTGLLVAPSDPSALAEALVFLADRPGLRHEMGRRGRARAAALYSTARLAERLVGLYRSLLQGRGRRSGGPLRRGR